MPGCRRARLRNSGGEKSTEYRYHVKEKRRNGGCRKRISSTSGAVFRPVLTLGSLAPRNCISPPRRGQPRNVRIEPLSSSLAGHLRSSVSNRRSASLCESGRPHRVAPADGPPSHLNGASGPPFSIAAYKQMRRSNRNILRITAIYYENWRFRGHFRGSGIIS